MNKLTGTILTLPKMSGNVGAKTINIGGKCYDGATFTPSVSADGIISWTNDKDLPNPEPVKIKGEKGDKGEPGKDGEDYVLTNEDKQEIAEMAAELVDVPDSGGNVDLTGYATEKYVREYAQPKGDYLTEVPEGYAKTEDIPAKPEDIGAQPAGNYLTEVPSGYATEEFVKNKIAEAELGGEEVDLSGYAQKSELPTKVSQLENDRQYINAAGAPVQSINGKTGKVQLGAADVGARPFNWIPTAQEVGALPDTYVPPNQTAAQVGADPIGTAATTVSTHNTSMDSHGDLRLELKAISDRLTAFFDSDNQTLDELSEIVAYITSNKELIDSITTSKVSVADIINNLATNVANKPLSAAQGVVLKGLIDAVSASLSDYQPKGDYALASAIPTKVSQLQNDKGYLTKHQDISGKLDADKLPEAVNNALAQAKESGEFDGDPGAPGVTPHIGSNGNWYIGSADTGVKAQGKDGTSVTVKSVSESTADGGSNVVTFSDGKTLTVKNGKQGSAGKTPVRGVDYYTEADKTEIVAMVIESLGGNPVFGYVDENNNIIVSGNLSDGTYSVKYEMEDGSTVNIGNLVLDSNVYYSVTNTLTNCTSNNSAKQAIGGQSYSATITANSGYELKSIVVKMGGTDISSTAVSGGKITISNVTGNIVITAVAEEVQASYTNLAKNFTTGRFKSSGAVDASTTAATACTDYIGKLVNGDIIRIKGFGAGTDYNSQWSNASKANHSCAKLTNSSTNFSYAYDSATGIITLQKTSDDAGYSYYRISGKLTGTTEDVIITLNEPIV